MGLVYALLIIAGAWAAWHRSPVYVGRHLGLRFLAVTSLLLLATFIVVFGTANFVQPLGEGPQFAIMGILVVALTLGLVFSIQELTTPKSTQLATSLPPAARVLTLHRSVFYRWLKFVACALALGGAGLLLPGSISGAFAGLDAILLLLALTLMPIFYVTARKFDRALTVLTLNPWVHWQYPATLWRAWCDVRVARAAEATPFRLSRSWHKLIGPFAIIAVGVPILSPLTLVQDALYVVGIWGLIVAILEFAAWAARRYPARLKVKLHDASPEAFFGQDGLYCNGRFLTWLGAEYYLTAATLDPRPPRSVLFHFEKLVPNPFGPLQVIGLDQPVLIPDGSEADLARLSRELAARCPTAHIALT